MNFTSKSTTAGNVHLMESLLVENWLKNNHVTVDIMYYPLHVSVFSFTIFSFHTYFSTALMIEGAKALCQDLSKKYTRHFISLSEQPEFIYTIGFRKWRNKIM